VVQEIIHKLNGPDESYWCDTLFQTSGYVVLRFDVQEPAQIGPNPIPAGSLTIAHYRDGTPYVLWEMYGPARGNRGARRLIGCCYHVCRPPAISLDEPENQSVEYTDLLLDLWFSPEGHLTPLDEDELEDATERGVVDSGEFQQIGDTLKTIAARHWDIIASLWRPPLGVASL
jgi:hypothetical protein